MAAAQVSGTEPGTAEQVEVHVAEPGMALDVAAADIETNSAQQDAANA